MPDSTLASVAHCITTQPMVCVGEDMTADQTSNPAKVVCLGNAVQDFVFSVDEMPPAPGKYRSGEFKMVGGGPAATAAVTVARLGGHVDLITRLGDDASATLMVTDLESEGVGCDYARRFADAGSSVSAVLVDNDGERLIVNYLDPSLPTTPDWIPSVTALNARSALADTRWPAGAESLLRAANEAGIPAILDADAPVAPAEGALRAATHIAFSAQGLGEYAASEDMDSALRRVSEETGAWCCVTLGGDGVRIARHGRLAHVQAFEVEVVDTLGAGDVWHGAFALALAEGRDEQTSVRFANAAAALKCRQHGGRGGVPFRADVTSFLALHTEDSSQCN